jgi:hypothetical protein
MLKTLGFLLPHYNFKTIKLKSNIMSTKLPESLFQI